MVCAMFDALTGRAMGMARPPDLCDEDGALCAGLLVVGQHLLQREIADHIAAAQGEGHPSAPTAQAPLTACTHACMPWQAAAMQALSTSKAQKD